MVVDVLELRSRVGSAHGSGVDLIGDSSCGGGVVAMGIAVIVGCCGCCGCCGGEL